MEREGLSPLPTFHFRSPLSELERLCDRYEYIALGGLVPLARNHQVLVPWLKKCFSVIKKFWPRRVHALGVTSQPILEAFPFFSCDSTSAIMGAGMGRVILFKDGAMHTSKWTDELRRGLYKTADKDCGSAHPERKIFNIISMLKFEEYITDLWISRGIVWKNNA